MTAGLGDLRRWEGRLAAAWSGRPGRTLRLASLVGLLAWVVVHMDVADALARARQADPRLVLVATTILVAVHIVAALGWRAVVLALGGRMSRKSALRAYYAAQAWAGVTPANLGGDAVRIRRRVAAGDGWALGSASVVLTRACSLGVLVMLGGCALAALPVASGMAPIIVSATGVGLGTAIAAGWLWRRASVPGRGSALIRATALGSVAALLFHALSIAAAYLLVLAVDPALHGGEVLAALTAARLAIAVPLSPAGIGLQEATAGWLFTLVGAPSEVAVAAVVLSRISLLATTGLGVIASAAHERPEPARNEEPPSQACIDHATVMPTDLMPIAAARGHTRN